MGTFQVCLTGLCAYVPDTEFGDPAKSPSKVKVLLVDALPTEPPVVRSGLDLDPLRPHAPVIACNSSILTNLGGLPDNLDLRLSFYRKELSFVPVGDANSFGVIQGTADGTDFNSTAHIKEIVDESTGVTLVQDACFKDSLSLGLIAARIHLDRGTLAVDKNKFDRKLEFDIARSLGGTFAQRPLPDEASLTFSNVTGVNIVVRDLDSNKTDTLSFNAPGDDIHPTTVTVGNLCGDSWLPFKTGVGATLLRPQIDDDFRWFYELFTLSSRSTWLKNLGRLPLPRPVPVRNGASGLQPVQCMGLSLHSQAF